MKGLLLSFLAISLCLSPGVKKVEAVSIIEKAWNEIREDNEIEGIEDMACCGYYVSHNPSAKWLKFNCCRRLLKELGEVTCRSFQSDENKKTQ